MNTDNNNSLKHYIFPQVPLAKWFLNLSSIQGESNDDMYIVLHTTCATYGDDELRKALNVCRTVLNRKNVWVIPDDVYYELKILAQNAHFRYLRSAAHFILKNSVKVSWHLTWLNNKSEKSFVYDKDFYPKMVFVFGDIVFLEQFVKYADDLLIEDHYYVLFGSPESVESRSGTISEILKCREIILERQKKRVAETEFTDIDLDFENSEVICLFDGALEQKQNDRFNNVFFEEFEMVTDQDGEELSGTYGRIASRKEKPFHYYKIFKRQPTVTMEEKLKRLQLIKRYCSISAINFPVSLPTRLLYRVGDKKELIGYEMKAYKAISMLERTVEYEYDSGIPQKLLKELILVLLELHCLHLFPKDLCMENCLVNDNEEVILIDVDGFQYSTIIGNIGAHIGYLYDGIKSDNQAVFFEEFVFAIIAFSIMTKCNPGNVLLNSAGLKKKKQGKRMTFIINNIRTHGVLDKVTENIIKRWNQLSDEQQESFRDTLDLKEYIEHENKIQKSCHIHGLGEWIEILDLFDEKSSVKKYQEMK